MKKFYEESIMFNWEMLEHNPNYYLELSSLTTFQKLDELYDLYVYFLEAEEFEKLSVIHENIKILRQKYHEVIRERKAI